MAKLHLIAERRPAADPPIRRPADPPILSANREHLPGAQRATVYEVSFLDQRCTGSLLIQVGRS
jgi:hypothetical protein